MARSRFAAMLIEEARDLTNMTYAKLDEALNYSTGTCTAYSKYPPRRKTRAPQADEIQDMENRVARLLKRPAHILVIENNALLTADDPMKSVVVGVPDLGLNLRDAEQIDLVIGYEDDWPTYRRLKYSPYNILYGESLVKMYAWQWGILWDRGVLPEPWTRETHGIPAGVPIENLIQTLVEKAKAMARAQIGSETFLAGIEPGMTGQAE